MCVGCRDVRVEAPSFGESPTGSLVGWKGEGSE